MGTEIDIRGEDSAFARTHTLPAPENGKCLLLRRRLTYLVDSLTLPACEKLD